MLMSRAIDFLLHSTSGTYTHDVSQPYSFKCSNKPTPSLGGLQQHPFASCWPLCWLLLFSTGLLQSEIRTKGKTPPCHILFFSKEGKERYSLALPFKASILCRPSSSLPASRADTSRKATSDPIGSCPPGGDELGRARPTSLRNGNLFLIAQEAQNAIYFHSKWKL